MSVLAASAMLSGAAVVVSVRAPRASPGLALVSSGAAFGGLGAAWAATIALGRWARDVVLGAGDSLPHHRGLLEVDFGLATIGPIILLVLTLAAFVTTAFTWSRVTRPRATAWIASACLAACPVVALIRAIEWGRDARAAMEEASRSFYGSGQGLVVAMTGARERWLEGSTSIVVAAVIAGLIGAAAAFVAQRAGTRTGWTPVVAAAVLFVGGVTAFAATRGHAADAALILPRDGLRRIDLDMRLIPTVTACDATPSFGPTFIVDDRGTSLDGRDVNLEAAREHLETTRRNWSILNPDLAAEPPPVLLGAAARTPLDSLAEHLDAAASADYRVLVVIAKRERTIRSEIRGALDMPQPCFVRVGLGGHDAVGTGDIVTVGDLVARAERDPGLAIAPRPRQ